MTVIDAALMKLVSDNGRTNPRSLNGRTRRNNGRNSDEL